MSNKKRKRKYRESSEILDEFIDDRVKSTSTKRKKRRRSSSHSESSSDFSSHSSKSKSGKRRKKRRTAPSKAVKKAPKAQESRGKKILDRVLIVIFFLLFIGMLVFYLKFDRAEVVSGSMEPTLMTNEKVIIINGKEAKPFNMLVFYPPSTTKEKYVKRVIGIPGDKVEFVGDKLLINGDEYDEPYLRENREAYQKEHPGESYTKDFQLDMIPGVASGVTKIPKDMYLVLGDNRQNSQDSRYIGLIPKENIIGIVWKKTPEKLKK